VAFAMPAAQLSLMADALDYPGANWPAVLAACRAAAAPGSELAAFVAAVADLPLGRLQELYTAAFDLQPDLSLNAGHHVFGEDYARSLLLVRLKEMFAARAFEPENRELPDHACLLLRFLARGEDTPEMRELAEDCLAPAVARLGERLEAAHHPYRHLARAIAAALPPPGAPVPRPAENLLPVLG